MSLFAQIGFRVVSIAAILGCLFAYYWPGVPRPLRRFEHDVLDLTPVGGGGYLSPWVRDADGHYRRG